MRALSHFYYYRFVQIRKLQKGHVRGRALKRVRVEWSDLNVWQKARTGIRTGGQERGVTKGKILQGKR